MGSDEADTLRRLEALEIRIAHQDQTISELNEVVTAQWSRIELVERQLARLRDEFQDVGPSGDGPEPPPPHY